MIGLVSFAMYFAAANTVYVLARHSLIVRLWTWIPTLLLINPAGSLLGLGASLLVSLRAKTYMEAQQTSALVVLPCILLIGVQASGVVVFSVIAMVALGLILLGNDYVLITRVGPRFEREQIISGL